MIIHKSNAEIPKNLKQVDLLRFMTSLGTADKWIRNF